MGNVRVSQTDGEIVVNAGGDVRTYPVTNGAVDVAPSEMVIFLRDVPGSFVAPVETPSDPIAEATKAKN